jgi:hypothetical protein
MGLIHAGPDSTAAAPAAAPFLQVSNISMRFGVITALVDIDTFVRRPTKLTTKLTSDLGRSHVPIRLPALCIS